MTADNICYGGTSRWLDGDDLDLTQHGYAWLDVDVLNSTRKVQVQAWQDYDVDGE